MPQLLLPKGPAADGECRVGYTTSKLQGLGDDAIRLYTKAASDLVVFALGVTMAAIPEWDRTKFSDEIKNASIRFLASLSTDSEDEQKESLQILFHSIFSQERTGSASKYSFLVYSFLVLYSFLREGHLDHCNKFTQSFSKLIWFARASIFKNITEEAKSANVGFFQ